MSDGTVMHQAAMNSPLPWGFTRSDSRTIQMAGEVPDDSWDYTDINRSDNNTSTTRRVLCTFRESDTAWVRVEAVPTADKRHFLYEASGQLGFAPVDAARAPIHVPCYVTARAAADFAASSSRLVLSAATSTNPTPGTASRPQPSPASAETDASVLRRRRHASHQKSYRFSSKPTLPAAHT